MSTGKVPAETPPSTGTQLAGMATSVMQTFTPIKQICVLANGFHAYVDNPARQVEASHFCSHLTEDVRQCLIYDSHDSLIGVEYMISAALFEALPEGEKDYWHSHAYEVSSGCWSLRGCLRSWRTAR
eukprot:TRINITY_DN4320_c0_g1_i2.p2 TRINITY_DN4320_c0_g1~~TRINITY_DN4320_c0_g1_i2.p2  ORF type:complete len:127 (-),score=5.26 TRINITY_DN4320_c0_g1_i2:249-629(-)